MLLAFNFLFLFVNFAVMGKNQHTLEIVNEKLEDISMVEVQLKHYLENLDSAFL